MQKRLRIGSALTGIVSVLVLLGGCERSAPSPEPTGNVEAPAEPETPAPPVPPVATPTPEATPEPEPSEPTAPDQQLQDDADATGMTARLSREEEAANASDRE